MKRCLLSFVLLFLTINTVFVQKDTEHWFAPYFDSTLTGFGRYVHALYLSTDSTTPFDVNIYNNNVVIGTVTISKGNPQSFTVDAAFIRTDDKWNTLKPINLGIYTKGDKPYLASLRVAQLV
ncbi:MULTISPECIES: hypothetical protein [Chryseobacterium]|uniref:Uncharacterized protein n=1 Tax=Chryseobacterium geocarposphaerae TaxID=1416776 RepID=A0ABU1LG98_9FLAO|nr:MULTISPECIES: hypothetical protein [Chryseobacterium]MDR6405753.1 hypothetical protein [Chryseobacterium geocarposphaerae]MDR6699084.1 hypothetical protein [Chryseobacterium ginsenosidimutans]